jgi:catechol 2,3-dioxygenase-like lactoylglutathione lyase family enzyme
MLIVLAAIAICNDVLPIAKGLSIGVKRNTDLMREQEMLGESPVGATLAVKDQEKAKEFYEGKLGLKIKDEMEGWVSYQCGKGTVLGVYPSQFAGTNEATGATFLVEDLEAEMKELRAKGIEFEEYDFPGLKTENGIASMDDDHKAAWFKDPDGNTIALTQGE